MDERPPVKTETIEWARRELAREYGLRVVDESGRRVLLVRVPRAQPDYNYELADVALYASLGDLKDVKDVLMVGDEKTVRMEPVRLRDHVRDQMREDTAVADKYRSSLARAPDAWALHTSESNHHHKALVLRIPVERLSDAGPEHFEQARHAVGRDLVNILRDTLYVYFVTDSDYGRVGRRIFVESLAPDLADAVAPGNERAANPLHLAHQTPGGTIRPTR